MELKQMKIRQGDFLHLKDEIFQVSQVLEEKQSILDEISSERKALQSELHRYIAMVRQVQKDFELAQRAEAELLKDRDQLSLHLTQLKNHDFKILKDEVDQLRTAKGLRPLPSLEQEEAEVMGRGDGFSRSDFKIIQPCTTVLLFNSHFGPVSIDVDISINISFRKDHSTES
ncbi:hypothetical protein BGZ98_010425 [Dissophora globulifera]|nr:hypothetical protein BGZ98_010425 [Dissophora globulifera]